MILHSYALLYIVLNLDFGSFLFIRYDAVNLSVKTIKPNLYQVIIMILIADDFKTGSWRYLDFHIITA